MKKRKLIIPAILIICALAACAWILLGGGAPSSAGEETVSAAPSSAPSPTPYATSAPTPALDPVEARLDELLASMTTEEKLWQMIMLRRSDANVLDEPLGGVIFFAGDISSAEALRSDTAELLSRLPIAPFIGVDEEGGNVARVQPTLGTTRFEPMFYYRDEGAETAYSNAFTIASDIAGFGFNVDFAPVADVWTNSANAVIGTRAYSDEPYEAALLVGEAVRGFRDGGVIAVLKHFPGHGNTAQDSHDGAAYSEKTAEELAQCEFLPFVSGIEAGAGMVMVGHVTLTSVDPDEAAVFSYAVVTGLLRDTLGWDGVVITDSLEMGAVSAVSSGEAAVRAVSAGVDILLQPEDALAAVAGLQNALETGSLSIERIDESVRRILRLKLENGVIE